MPNILKKNEKKKTFSWADIVAFILWSYGNVVSALTNFSVMMSYLGDRMWPGRLISI